MGLIRAMTAVFDMIFGGERNVVKETAEVFRPNAEAQAARQANYDQAALSQFAAEFAHARIGWFDRFVDGLNRLPRPLLALGTIALFVSAMYDPVWFADRMQGLALVPEPLWWLLGVVVSFFFGARHSAKSQEFQKSIAATVALAPTVVKNVAAIRALDAGSPGSASSGSEVSLEIEATSDATLSENAAVADWQKSQQP